MGSPVLVGMPTLRTLNPLFYQEFQYVTSNVLGFDPINNQDQGLNYWDRSVVTVAGGAVVSEVPNANSGLIRFGNVTNKGRVFDITIFNFINRNKVVMVNNQIGSGLAGTPGEINCGAGGEWLNLVQQINRIDFKTAGGAVKILAGSTMLVQAWAGMHN